MHLEKCLSDIKINIIAIYLKCLNTKNIYDSVQKPVPIPVPKTTYVYIIPPDYFYRCDNTASRCETALFIAYS